MCNRREIIKIEGVVKSKSNRILYKEKLTVAEEKCKGCIYNLTDTTKTDVEKLSIFLDNCCSCKRAMIEEYQGVYSDLYEAAK